LVAEAKHLSKTMISLGKQGRPFLDYVLYNARAAGYRDIVIVIGENDDAIRHSYGKLDFRNEFHGLTISYAIQKIPPGRIKPLGTADALACGLKSRPDWRGQKISVCNSDNLYSVNAMSMLLHSEYPSAMIDYDRDALQFEQSRIEQFAVIQKDCDGWLTNIVEKPQPGELLKLMDPAGRIGVSMNIFRFTYDTILPWLDLIPLHPVRKEKEIPAAIMMMINRSESKRIMYTYPVAELVPDLTMKDDISRVQEYLEEHFPDFTMELP